jgi:hypothetical protein
MALANSPYATAQAATAGECALASAFSAVLQSAPVYLIEMKDELPSFAIAEVSALLLSQKRVLRQFPIWRDFERDASQFVPTMKLPTISKNC